MKKTLMTMITLCILSTSAHSALVGSVDFKETSILENGIMTTTSLPTVIVNDTVEELDMENIELAALEEVRIEAYDGINLKVLAEISNVSVEEKILDLIEQLEE